MNFQDINNILYPSVALVMLLFFGFLFEKYNNKLKNKWHKTKKVEKKFFLFFFVALIAYSTRFRFSVLCGVVF